MKLSQTAPRVGIRLNRSHATTSLAVSRCHRITKLALVPLTILLFPSSEQGIVFITLAVIVCVLHQMNHLPDYQRPTRFPIGRSSSDLRRPGDHEKSLVVSWAAGDNPHGPLGGHGEWSMAEKLQDVLAEYLVGLFELRLRIAWSLDLDDLRDRCRTVGQQNHLVCQ